MRGRTCSSGDGNSWTIGPPTSTGSPRRWSHCTDDATCMVRASGSVAVSAASGLTQTVAFVESQPRYHGPDSANGKTLERRSGRRSGK